MKARSNIIDFTKYREKRKWVASMALCAQCGNKHVAVYPTDIINEFEQQCPYCGAMACFPIEG